MNITRVSTISLLSSLSILLSAGCGRDSGHDHAAGAKSAAPVVQVARPPVVNIEADDNMKFSVTRIEAAAGESITLTLKITGRLPKSSMGHNWILLALGADARAYCMAAMTASASDYQPEALSDQVIVHTKLLGPGESDTITFDAPTEPGEYHFVCSFPGHYINGMGGVLVVR